jgi:3-isopropylmalate/(R)-2-methylmalate dehydratase large subunit
MMSPLNILPDGSMRPRVKPGNAAWKRGASCPLMKAQQYDNRVVLDASMLEPMITYGTNPGMSIPIGGCLPQFGEVGENGSGRPTRKRWITWP